MERSWLFARLVSPAGRSAHDNAVEVLTTVVPALVEQLRRYDRQGSWFFERCDEAPRPYLDLGFHATQPVLGDLAGQLCGSGDRCPATVEVHDSYAVPDAAHGGPLAVAASELALTLFGAGEWYPDLELPVAVLHLRHLVELLPPNDRLGFLFLFWREQVRALSPAHRRELAAEADARAEKIVLTALELAMPATFAAAWQSYLGTVTAVAGPPGGAGLRSLGHLLFHHAEATHRRLGIPADVAGLAAMALRLSLAQERCPEVPTAMSRPPTSTGPTGPVDTSAGTGASTGTGTVQVEVALGDRAYPVLIGAGVRHRLPEFVRQLGARRAVVVSARPADWTPDPGVPRLVVPARDGEEDKTLATVEELCRAFADFGLSRADVVVSCGGGTTTDVVGLAAGLYHRGISVIHLPTSLLAQVDASVGGKTAVNLPHGKNLVGVYWQPRAVLCDTDYLSTLPPREWVNGCGEIARAHFIGAGELRGLPTHEQIAACVALKASVVAADERDAGLRHILNYGHTLGHALERATDFALRHGEAVGIGTVFAGRLAGLLGRIDDARVAVHEEVVAHYGLATTLPAGVDRASLVGLMRLDKKATSGLAFVLDGPDGPELVTGVDEAIVLEALASMAAGDVAA